MHRLIKTLLMYAHVWRYRWWRCSRPPAAPAMSATLPDGQTAAGLGCLPLTPDDLIDYGYCQSSPRPANIQRLAKIKASSTRLWLRGRDTAPQTRPHLTPEISYAHAGSVFLLNFFFFFSFFFFLRLVSGKIKVINSSVLLSFFGEVERERDKLETWW